MEIKSRVAASKKRAKPRVTRSGNGHQSPPFKRVTRRQIRAVVDRIVKFADPDKVILFGSYAYGKPNADSDVDLLVIMESDERPAKRATRIELNLLDVPFPMDILVRTPSEVAQRLEMQDYFIQEITGQGHVLYERD